MEDCGQFFFKLNNDKISTSPVSIERFLHVQQDVKMELFQAHVWQRPQDTSFQILSHFEVRLWTTYARIAEEKAALE